MREEEAAMGDMLFLTGRLLGEEGAGGGKKGWERPACTYEPSKTKGTAWGLYGGARRAMTSTADLGGDACRPTTCTAAFRTSTGSSSGVMVVVLLQLSDMGIELSLPRLEALAKFSFGISLSQITNFEGCRVLVARQFLSSRVIVHDGPLKGNVDIHSNTFSFDVILLKLISGRASLSKALLIAPSHDINNLAGEEAVGNVDDDMGYLDLGIIDSDDFTVDKSSEEREGYEEVKLEKDHAAEEMKALKAKMVALNDALKAVDIVMEEMESSVKNNAQAMQQKVNAPW
ncbi:hypothetical protein ACQ4PT_067253 [Festuca glaucescens]